jgi:TolA-binding protein
MRNIVILFIALIIASNLTAQPQRPGRQGGMQPDARREAIESRKIAYITKQLSLTAEEAREFWPVYNEYNEKVEELSDIFREQREQLPDVAEMNEEEATKFVMDDLERFETAAALRREYTEKMLRVLSVQKIAMLFEAEKSFNRMLFREAQRRHRPDGRGEMN